jgi:D-alanyl-D-alanine carboxypeptidase (penicillin-binding protein 5/6)
MITSKKRNRLIWALLVLALVATTTGFALTRIDRHKYLGTDGWPNVGQGSYRLGTSRPAVSPKQHPVPIASLAKVMTAYVVLRQMPLDANEDGPTYTVSAADVADTERRRAQDQSIVTVDEGEILTERQALMALLLPSANNVAAMLAEWVSDTQERFVAEMNRVARTLDMNDTTYTDPSGFDNATVSTATDQLTLAEGAARQPVLAAMMMTRAYALPVVGTVRNTDTLLGKGGFVGMKTGSDDAAGSCFMFHALRIVDGRSVDLIGVVLGQPGQPGQPLVRAGLTAARQLADRVAPGIKHP